MASSMISSKAKVIEPKDIIFVSDLLSVTPVQQGVGTKSHRLPYPR
jgi:hypothetical protein